MRSSAQTTGRIVIALALTWDGARWPVRRLPAEARAFLAGEGTKKTSIPSARATAKLFLDDRVKEIRICWVPRLGGGDNVLSAPFSSPAKMRIGFRSVETVRLDDLLGVIYRRANLLNRRFGRS